MTPELKSRIRTTVQQARALLMQETREQLISLYGLRLDGKFEPEENLPGLKDDPQRYQTRRQLQLWMQEEENGGLPPTEAVEKLIKETAFTWLNRLVAFKMMETLKIIRPPIHKGTDSNGFKFYLADHEADLRLYESGQVEEAYRNFLLWQCRQIAEQDHLEVLFNPDDLPSRLFPRPRALNQLLEMLNDPGLAEAWQQEETIGWVYQYFIEEDKDAVFEKIYRHKQKMDLRDIPKATQIFTPRWIVQYLVENTLGRLWLRMHPDSRLREKMTYYVPNPYTDNQPLPVKSVREITLLDPACGTMHFGLVAFDLFYEMYLEELENAGQPGWPDFTMNETADEHGSTQMNKGKTADEHGLTPIKNNKELIRDNPRQSAVNNNISENPRQSAVNKTISEHPRESAVNNNISDNPRQPAVEKTIRNNPRLSAVNNNISENPRASAVKKEDIPVAIVENNLYGIDIDLRAIQLSALTLYLKVKRVNKNARIRKLNLTYTDIPPIPEAEMDAFVEGLNLSHPIARGLLREILPELNKAYYLGSLLKIEEVVQRFIREKRRELEKQPIAAISDFGEEAFYQPETFWQQIKQDIVVGLQVAVERQTNGHSLVAGETIQGLGLIDALMKKHDVVVANPPFSGRRNWNTKYASEIKAYYPQNSSDMYAAFIERFKELARSDGFIGFVTSQTFMFTSSYSNLRELLIEKSSIQTIMHLGNWSEFDSGGRIEGALAFVAMVLQNKIKQDNRLVCFRHVADKDYLKFATFQKALYDWQAHGEAAADRHIFVVRQEDFKAIPGWPLVYWVSEGVRKIFLKNNLLNKFADACQGIATADNFRFLREWWEVSAKNVFLNCQTHTATLSSKYRWFPYMKGGDFNKWFGNIEFMVNWYNDGLEIKNYFKNGRLASRPQNSEFYFKEGATYSFLTVSNLSVRYLPPGFIFDVIGSSIFPKQGDPKLLIALLNSKISSYLIKILNPTVAFQVGDIARLPYPDVSKYPELVQAIEQKTQTCIHLKRSLVQQEPTSWEYVAPPDWRQGLREKLWKDYRLAVLESEISEMVYQLYEVGEEDIRQIEAEFHPLPTRGENLTADERGLTQINKEGTADLHGFMQINKKNKSSIRENPRKSAVEKDIREHPRESAVETIKKYYLEKHIPEEALKSEEEVVAEEEVSGNGSRSRRQARYLTFEEVCIASGYHPDTVYRIISEAGWERPEERFAVAYNWLEYAIGILMGRFQPGVKGELGSGIIHQNDFITGSLSISGEEFEEITRFFPTAYSDSRGKHRFPPDVEEQLRQMADPDGIMVLDEGHPDDLPARVEDVLTILLGEEQAQQVIASLIGEALPDRMKFRRFMERDFFSKHHLKMYRKRPIYWLLQTANKNYGFYIFHERIDKDTLYKLQRNYIDPKLNWIEQQIKELTAHMAAVSGPEQRRLAREKEKLEDLYQEIKEFAEKVNKVLNLKDEAGRVVGYDPDINDGVILNMAPLHELIPWAEPAKYWKELQAGRYDWAHIAMRYWPERVREKCKRDKSLAIAHGIEEQAADEHG